MPQNRSFGY
eukprot:CCRYP_001620-RA/>CCRYP_001620-RA protein AED:0.49 eAED:0.49 QI:0/-1/0/1/-1/0/1/0/9